MCRYCNIKNEAPLNLFTDEEYNRIIDGIRAGIITTSALDIATYLMIAKKLTSGVFTGFGHEISDVVEGNADYRMLFDLRRNVYVFSGAKTYQQIREVIGLLTSKNTNEIKSFADFKVKAKEVLVRYNEDWLHAEYNTAISSSRSASQWMDFTKNEEIYPMLTYHTAGDLLVRPTHQLLDGISRPVNDKFWDYYLPPNGWNCRCTVLQGGPEIERTNLQGFKKPKDVPDIFMMNAGKDKIVFSPKHPYFKVAPKDKNNAKNNWGMPIP